MPAKLKLLPLFILIIILIAGVVFGYKYLNRPEPEYFLDATLTDEQKQEYQRRIEQNFEQLKVFPDNYVVYVDLGNLETELGNASKAIEYYQKAWEIIPTNATPWLNIGNIYIRLGQYQKAEEAFLKARDIRPDYFLSYFNLAELYRDFLREKEDQVRSVYLEGLIKTNNDYQLLYFFIQHLLEEGINSEALEYLKVYVDKTADAESRQWALEKIQELESLSN